jgi:hypothetical protein
MSENGNWTFINVQKRFSAIKPRIAFFSFFIYNKFFTLLIKPATPVLALLAFNIFCCGQMSIQITFLQHLKSQFLQPKNSAFFGAFLLAIISIYKLTKKTPK